MIPRALHPNTTQFPNVLLDTLLAILAPSEWKTLCYIVRRTYGWQRERERIPYAELEAGRPTSDGKKMIDNGTGLSRSTLTKALYVLNALGVLERMGERTQVRTYWLRLDFDTESATEAKLEEVRSEYDRKLESLQMKLPLPRDADPPARKRGERPPPPITSAPRRVRTVEDRLRLLNIDLENIRKGRITAGSVARRMKLSIEDVERMVREEIIPSLP